MLNYPVTVGLYLDTRRKLQDDTYPVKLRVTQRYLDNFEKDKREEVAKNLLPWAN